MPGVFGKIRAQGDFLRINAPDPALARFLDLRGDTAFSFVPQTDFRPTINNGRRGPNTTPIPKPATPLTTAPRNVATRKSPRTMLSMCSLPTRKASTSRSTMLTSARCWPIS